VNFFKAGIETTLYLGNGDNQLTFLLAFAVGLVLFMILSSIVLFMGSIRKKCCIQLHDLTGKLKERVYGILFWSGTMRLFLELYLDIALFSTLNLRHIYWQEEIPAVSLSNVFAIINVIVFIAIIPLGVFAYVIMR